MVCRDFRLLIGSIALFSLTSVLYAGKSPNNNGKPCSKNEDCSSQICYFETPVTSEEKETTIEGRCLGKSGTRCHLDIDCHSGHCYQVSTSKICTTQSATMGKVGGGGFCQTDNQCFSGRCHVSQLGDNYPKTCSTDGPREGSVGTLGDCSEHSQCFSNYCYQEEAGHKYCAHIAPAPGFVGTDGPCIEDKQCYSGYCYSMLLVKTKVCAKDGPRPNTIGGGGRCLQDNQCFSGFCHLHGGNEGGAAVSVVWAATDDTGKGVCALDSWMEGKVGSGDHCETDKHCLSNYCHILEEKEGRERKICAASADVAGKVAGGGYCKTNDQCKSAVCTASEKGSFCQ